MTDHPSSFSKCIYVGLQITFPVRQALSMSIEWKHDQLIPGAETPKRFLHHNCEYVGYTLNVGTLSLGEARAVIDKLRQQLAHYLPSYEPEAISLVFLPQIVSSSQQIPTP